MNAVHISNPDRYNDDVDQPFPQVAHAHTPVTLYCAVNPEQLFEIQQNNWQLGSNLQTRLQPLSNQRAAEDIAEHWHVQKSGAGFVIAFRVKADFLQSIKANELMGEQGYELIISAKKMHDLKENIIESIFLVNAYYSSHHPSFSAKKTAL
ncbi:MAG: hypothetical protein JKY01_14455 [Pseudomonadales bacterium]|nr:hypothetical protein [Pseudomonadales bacterium]